MLPTSRPELKSYILRALGAPVLKIQVSNEQIEDRIDEALKYYYDYHFDGTEKVFYKHKVTAADKKNKYITLPDNIIGAVRIFDVGFGANSGGMFSVEYQIALNDLYTLTSASMVPYYITKMGLEQMEQILVGKKPIRYNRNRNILQVDMNWNVFAVGDYLVVEAYQVVDPEEFNDVYSDRWLMRYATALVKRQWGTNLTMFVGMQLPGGVQFNGDRILSDAQAEIAQMEAEMQTAYSLPPMDMIG